MPFSIRPYKRFPVHCFMPMPYGGIRITRLLLIMLLLLSSGPAYAEWVKVTEAGDDQSTMYADPKTIRVKGKVVKMWDLRDYKTIQTSAGKSYLSVKGQNEYDCAEEQFRILAFFQYKGLRGTGEIVYSKIDPHDTWSPVMPGSIGQAMWIFACNKP